MTIEIKIQEQEEIVKIIANEKIMEKIYIKNIIKKRFYIYKWVINVEVILAYISYNLGFMYINIKNLRKLKKSVNNS